MTEFTAELTTTLDQIAAIVARYRVGQLQPFAAIQNVAEVLENAGLIDREPEEHVQHMPEDTCPECGVHVSRYTDGCYACLIRASEPKPGDRDPAYATEEDEIVDYDGGRIDT